MLYWYENRLAHQLTRTRMTPSHGFFIKDINSEHRELHLLQNENIEMLFDFDVHSVTKVFLNYVVFFAAVLALTFTYVKAYEIKRMQTHVLFLRVWRVLLISWTTVGGGVIVLNVWTHNLKFFRFLQIYYYYSTFMCVSAIINSKRENSTAIMILLIAMGVQLATKCALQIHTS